MIGEAGKGRITDASRVERAERRYRVRPVKITTR